MKDTFDDKIKAKIKKVATHFGVNEQEVILAYKSVFKDFRSMVSNHLHTDVVHKSVFIQRIGTFYPKPKKVEKVKEIRKQAMDNQNNNQNETN